MINLYPDQTEVVNAVRAEYGAGHKHVLLQSATGSGKSYMGSYMVAGALAKGNTCWFVVPRITLIEQMSEAFDNFGIKHSFIASGLPYNPHHNVHIVSLATIREKLTEYRLPSFCVLDEVHFGGKGIDDVINTVKAAGGRTLGLTATPMRTDGVGLGVWFGTMVMGKPIKWLIDNKRLSEYTIDSINPELASDPSFEKNKLVVGNVVNTYKQRAMGRLGITFGNSIEHSKDLAQAYRDAGVPAMHMDGTTHKDERRRIAKAYARREILQICNNQLMTFGYDLASASGIKGVTIEVMSDVNITNSLPLQKQKWGRVLRMKDKPAQIFDFVGNALRHGMPCGEPEWTLDSMTGKERASAERLIPSRTCPKCDMTDRIRKACAFCKYVFPIQAREIDEREGELLRLTPEALAEAQQRIEDAKRARRMTVGKATSRADIEAIARERGYKSGWVYHQCKMKGFK